MFAREISHDTVLQAVHDGEVIAQYSDDKPYPSYLMLYLKGEKPIHCVIAREDQSQTCFIITTYVPSLEIWHPDFKTRK